MPNEIFQKICARILNPRDMSVEEIFQGFTEDMLNILDNEYKFTLLHYAASFDNLPAARFLMQYENLRTDIKADDYDGAVSGGMPIHHAAHYGYAEIVSAIIEYDKGKTINEADDDKFTPLHHAVSQLKVKSIKILLQHNALVSSAILEVNKDRYIFEQAPSVPAVPEKILDSIKEIHRLLIETTFQQICSRIQNPRDMSIEEIFEGFTENMLDMQDYFQFGLLHYAAESGNLAAVTFLSQQKGLKTDLITLDSNYMSDAMPIHYAAHHGHAEIVAAIIAYDQGKTINAANSLGITPLQEAVTQKRVNVIQVFLQHRALLNIDCETTEPTNLTHIARLTGIPTGSTALKMIELMRDDLQERLAAPIQDEFDKRHRALQQQNLLLFQEMHRLLREQGATTEVKKNKASNNKKIFNAAKKGWLADLQAAQQAGGSLSLYDAQGITNLQWAAYYGHLNIVIYLARQVPDLLKKVDSLGRTVLMHAACGDQPEVIIHLHKQNKLKLEDVDKNNQTALWWAANQNKRNAFNVLLLLGALLNDTIIHNAHADIQAFLNYRPGRKAQSVLELHKAKKLTPEILEKLTLDYEDSTDNSSSDEEELEKCEEMLENQPARLPPEEEKTIIDHHHEKVNAFNQARKNGKLEYPAHADLKYILHRGVHFDPTYFDKQKRRAFVRECIRNPNATEATLSYATQQLFESEQKQSTVENSNAHKTVQAYLDQTKATANKKPKNRRDKRETEYARLMQEYVHSYAEVVSKGGIKTDFSFTYPHNPLISTSYLSKVAYVYASGMLSPKANRLNPHYRRSTGKPKHPIIGVAYSYTIDPSYAFDHSTNVLDWNHQGKIGIKLRYQSQCEVIFESFIPQKFMLFRRLLKLPSFSVDKAKSPPRLEYNSPSHKGAFTRHQNSVQELKASINADTTIYAEHSIVNNIIRHTIEKEQAVASQELTTHLYRHGLFPCYPFKDQTLSVQPIVPPTKGKWGNLENPTTPLAKTATSRAKKTLLGLLENAAAGAAAASAAGAAAATDEQKKADKEIDVPNDNHCLFWSIALAFLLPVLDNEKEYNERYSKLFSPSNINPRERKHINTILRQYDYTNNKLTDPLLKRLIGETFRTRTVNYMEVEFTVEKRKTIFTAAGKTDWSTYAKMMRTTGRGGDAEIQAASELIGAKIVLQGGITYRPSSEAPATITIVQANAEGSATGPLNHYHFILSLASNSHGYAPKTR